MGCSASSLLPINKAISPTDAQASEDEKKSTTNGVNGSKAENAVQLNGVTKVPPSPILEEVTRERKEGPDNETSKDEKPDEEVIATTKPEVVESSTTGVEKCEEKVESGESKENVVEKETIDESNGATHESAPNDIEPVSGLTIATETTGKTETAITVVEEISTIPPSTPTQDITPTPEQSLVENVPEPKENAPELVIPIISDEGQPEKSLEISEQPLKLPDEGNDLIYLACSV